VNRDIILNIDLKFGLLFLFLTTRYMHLDTRDPVCEVPSLFRRERVLHAEDCILIAYLSDTRESHSRDGSWNECGRWTIGHDARADSARERDTAKTRQNTQNVRSARRRSCGEYNGYLYYRDRESSRRNDAVRGPDDDGDSVARAPAQGPIGSTGCPPILPASARA